MDNKEMETGRVSMILVMIALLAGCAATKQPGPAQPAPDPVVQQRPSGPLPPSTRPVYNLAGYPEAAQQGYIDGCETVKQSAYGFKDKKRYVADVQYQMGWNDGFSICRGKRK